MKKLLNFCALLCSMLPTNAQVNIVLNVQPTPAANFNTWSQRNEVITLVSAGSAQGSTLSIKINATLETADGTPVAKTDITRAALRQLPAAGSAIFYAKDVFDPGAFIFNSAFQNQLNQTGKLKAGTYRLIVSLFNAAGTAQISNEQTKIFTIVAAQLPVLIAPANEAILNEEAAQTAIVFRWTPILPRPQEPVSYTILVFEILDGQTPMQALRSNQPILNTEVRGATQYVWRPQLGMAEEGRNKFIWTIRSTDVSGTAITGESTNGDAVSEPSTFSFRKGWNGKTNGTDQKITDSINNQTMRVASPACCIGSSWGLMQYKAVGGAWTNFTANANITDPLFRVGRRVKFKVCYNLAAGCQCSMQFELLHFPSLLPVSGYTIPSSGSCCNPIKIPMPQPPGHYALRITAFGNGTLCATSINDFYSY